MSFTNVRELKERFPHQTFFFGRKATAQNRHKFGKVGATSAISLPPPPEISGLLSGERPCGKVLAMPLPTGPTETFTQ